MSEHTDHPPYLGHHYETAEQQFDSGKLGMWLFLATEILLFAGLFCAYAIYRHHHPEIFLYAHQFLDKELGGVNTLVLITSSFTMAMGVRAAQLGKQRMTALLLALTLLGGVGFLAIKKVEYEHKWKHGLLWGTKYQDQEHHEDGGHGEGTAPADGHSGLVFPGVTIARAADPATATGEVHAPAAGEHAADPAGGAETGVDADAGQATPEAAPVELTRSGEEIPRSMLPGAAEQPEGLAPEGAAEGHHGPTPKNVHIFFGIYFLMTGLHGLHVIAGMIAIAWVLVRTLKGHFSPEYSTPVDLVGLYWHLVDLIWIYLFPLLYLIH